MEYQVIMKWEYMVSVDRRVTVVLTKRVDDDPTGQFLQYKIVVYHDGITVHTVSIEKFHTAMFTFHKTIDLEVRHHVTSV